MKESLTPRVNTQELVQHKHSLEASPSDSVWNLEDIFHLETVKFDKVGNTTFQRDSKVKIQELMQHKQGFEAHPTDPVWTLNIIDHSDPSKPSHRLTNGPKPLKTIESDGSKTKNH